MPFYIIFYGLLIVTYSVFAMILLYDWRHGRLKEDIKQFNYLGL